MKKNKKAVYTAYALRHLIDTYKEKTGKVFENSYDLGYYINHHDFSSDDEISEFEESQGMEYEMVTFYDHDHQKLSSNWICNSDMSQYSWVGDSRGYGDWGSEWGIALPLSYYYDVDLLHFTWGDVSILPKVRYISIGKRSGSTEEGIEIEVHTGKTRDYSIDTGIIIRNAAGGV